MGHGDTGTADMRGKSFLKNANIDGKYDGYAECKKSDTLLKSAVPVSPCPIYAPPLCFHFYFEMNCRIRRCRPVGGVASGRGSSAPLECAVDPATNMPSPGQPGEHGHVQKLAPEVGPAGSRGNYVQGEGCPGVGLGRAVTPGRTRVSARRKPLPWSPLRDPPCMDPGSRCAGPHLIPAPGTPRVCHPKGRTASRAGGHWADKEVKGTPASTRTARVMIRVQNRTQTRPTETRHPVDPADHTRGAGAVTYEKAGEEAVVRPGPQDGKRWCWRGNERSRCTHHGPDQGPTGIPTSRTAMGPDPLGSGSGTQARGVKVVACSPGQSAARSLDGRVRAEPHPRRRSDGRSSAHVNRFTVASRVPVDPYPSTVLEVGEGRAPAGRPDRLRDPIARSARRQLHLGTPAHRKQGH